MSEMTVPRFAPAQDVPNAADVPVALLVDVSGSMAWSGSGQVPAIDVVNHGVQSLITTLQAHPEAADTAYVEVVKFSDTAEVVMGWSNIQDATTAPTLSVEGGTSFGAGLRLVRQEIESMVPARKATGATVFRPTVYVITDGEPTDSDWEAELDTLATSQFAPNVCVFGCGEVNVAQLRSIARRDRGFVWLADDGLDPADVFASVFPALIRSVMLSARSAAQGQAPAAPIPASIPGMSQLDAL